MKPLRARPRNLLSVSAAFHLPRPIENKTGNDQSETAVVSKTCLTAVSGRLEVNAHYSKHNEERDRYLHPKRLRLVGTATRFNFNFNLKLNLE